MVLGSFSPTYRSSNTPMHQTSWAAPQPLVMVSFCEDNGNNNDLN